MKPLPRLTLLAVLTLPSLLSVGHVASAFRRPADPRVVPEGAPPEGVPESPEVLLRSFVEDYRTDRTARPLVFGIEVRDAEPARWTVFVGEREEGETETPVELAPDFPFDPAPYFTTDLATLRRIHSGELGSLTAMGKAFSTDSAPLDLELQPGYEPDPELGDHLVRLGFHFWTRGFPERVRFGKPENTRPLHGANATLFYYQEGFRSGFFQVRPGEHANADPLSRTNPFPTLLVVTAGRMQARIGDTNCVLAAGEAVHVGAGVSHEFWVDAGAEGGAEGVLLMFGDGA